MAVAIGDHTHCVKEVTKESSQEPALTCCFFDCNSQQRHFLSTPIPTSSFNPALKALRYCFAESVFVFIICLYLTHAQNLYPKDWIGSYGCFLGDAQNDVMTMPYL